MIINTGCRTDIPAFYAEWFINRIKEGYVLVRNPYNPSQVTKYSLKPEVVDCLAFCTKNPEPILPYRKVLQPYQQYWFVTITPYGKEIEPNVPDKEKVIESFQKLSQEVGIDSIGWRYDPIFIGMGFSVKRHIEAFQKMAKVLKGYTKNCTISFLDLYEKVKRNAPNIYPPSREETMELAKAFSQIGKENGMTIHACCEKTYLEEYGIDCKGCMTQEIVEKAIGEKLNPPKRKNIRESCNCLMGNDIGAYDTCGHLCKYCYANTNSRLVKENRKRHNPLSPFLLGEKEEGDKITEAKQESWKVQNKQISFFE